ncbi:MAG: U32 family peptidase [Selenomonadaceae bacterium]|nr:U32 family peptidase [Selenomonadaceae bacterium]
MINKVELLAPAGNLEKLKIALIYGADAVYIGGQKFGLRAYADNFTDDEFIEAVNFAHGMNRKIYVTVNVFAHNSEIDELPDYLRFLEQIGVDAVLVSDIGVFSLAKEVTKNLEVHISTQANITNYKSAQMWRKLGASRVVLARELNESEIISIKNNSDVELEMFVHGAMCISYSGRCYLSHYLTGRDGNLGQCTHSCRWKYTLVDRDENGDTAARYTMVEQKRPGEQFDVTEDEHGAYIMNSKDLCLLPYLDKIIQSGVSSLKIEGRMKSVNYVASVVKVYREAIDAYYENPQNFQVRDSWISQLDRIAHRPYTSGFFIKDDNETEIYDTSKAKSKSTFLGIVRSYDSQTKIATVEQRGKLQIAQQIEILQPNNPSVIQRLSHMTDEDGNLIEAAPHAQQIVKIKMDNPVESWSLIRTDSE